MRSTSSSTIASSSPTVALAANLEREWCLSSCLCRSASRGSSPISKLSIIRAHALHAGGILVGVFGTLGYDGVRSSSSGLGFAASHTSGRRLKRP